jgi:hypothetical protein
MGGLEPELFIERVGEVVVAPGDGLPQSERIVGLERQPPRCLVELVEDDRLLGQLQRAGGVAAFEAGVADALQEADQGGAQTVDVPVAQA